MHRIRRRVLRTRIIIVDDDYNSYCRVSDGVGGKSRRAKGIDARAAAAAVVSEDENVE